MVHRHDSQQEYHRMSANVYGLLLSIEYQPILSAFYQQHFKLFFMMQCFESSHMFRDKSIAPFCANFIIYEGRLNLSKTSSPNICVVLKIL